MDNRRKKPVITGNAQFTPSSSGQEKRAAVRQRTDALYSPVNPFEADRRKENKSSTPVSSDKRKDPPSKTASTGSLATPTACKRLSSDFHRKCCAHENDNDHDHSSCKSLSDRKHRSAESPSPSADRMALSRRSQSVPRAALRPITTTLSTIKRMEFNLERARDAANNSPMPVRSPHSTPFTTMSSRRTPVTGSRTPVTPAVFSTTKTPVHSARIAKGIMSGSKPKTPPVASSSQALTLPKSLAAPDHKTTPLTDRKAVTESKSLSAVQYSQTRVSVKTPTAGKDGTGSRRDADHVTVTQSGGKGNVNIRMKISMDIKKNAESGQNVDEADGARLSIEQPSSPRIRSSALLSYVPPVVREYPVEKTAVAVAVRLRPFSTRELRNPDVSRVVFLDKDKRCVTVNKNEFEFNHVLDSFDPDPIDDQEQVYEVVGKPLLDHCLEGYNACLFAYGQTGSGKTYSLTGEEDVLFYDKQGVIPRLIKDLFLEMQLDSIVSMTYIEIYNDQIFNLLGDTTSDLQQLTYKIRESTIFGPYIPNLAPVVVENADDLLSRWSMGNIKRQKAATSCNDHSSRSHAILQITVQQKYLSDDSLENADTDADSQVSDGDRLVSKINLVDLAGSERVAQAQTTGDRFKEGTAINKSLLTLGKVISELSSMSENRGKVHIPYRESALTFLLKESLGGNSRTCMLATISPANTQIEETLSTLRYASKAQRIVNRVRINEDPKILRIRQLEGELQRLRQMLDNRNIGDKCLPGSASPTASSAADTTLSSVTNSSAENSSNTSTTAAASEYATPSASLKGSKSQDKDKGKSEKSAKTEDKKRSEKSESKAEKKSSKSDPKNDAKAADEKQKSTEKKKSKHKEEKDLSNQSVESVPSSPGTRESDGKAHKSKQSSSTESESVSPAKKEKKNTVSEKTAKKTKTTDSAVNTETPSEPKKKKVEKLVIPPVPQSKLLESIGEIFSEHSDTSRNKNETSESLTFVSAGDASSILNNAVIESSSSAMSDSTVQEVSRHVNFRDTVSMRSYQPSSDSIAAEVSAVSASPPEKKSDKKSASPRTSSPEKKEKKSGKKDSPEKSDKKKSSPKKKAAASDETSATETQSDWGTGTSDEWGAGATAESSGGWGAGTESSGGWGSSDTKDETKGESESKETAAASESGGWGASEPTESGDWGTSNDAPTESGDWGGGGGASGETADAGGWGATDDTPGDSWAAQAGSTAEELSWGADADELAKDPPTDMSWGAVEKANGVTDAKADEKKDDGWGGDGGGW